MKKLFAAVLVLAFAAPAIFAGPVLAQRQHTPKTVWLAMLAGLNDIQSITGALAVFDMKRAATIAEELAKREEFISKIPTLSDDSKAGHAKVAAAAKELAAAAKAGEEQQVSMKIGEVLGACSACHYNVRDASRRK